jgi:hypothetical protein
MDFFLVGCVGLSKIAGYFNFNFANIFMLRTVQRLQRIYHLHAFKEFFSVSRLPGCCLVLFLDSRSPTRLSFCDVVCVMSSVIMHCSRRLCLVSPHNVLLTSIVSCFLLEIDWRIRVYCSKVSFSGMCV